jgi:hypothetical protein
MGFNSCPSYIEEIVVQTFQTTSFTVSRPVNSATRTPHFNTFFPHFVIQKPSANMNSQIALLFGLICVIQLSMSSPLAEHPMATPTPTPALSSITIPKSKAVDSAIHTLKTGETNGDLDGANTIFLGVPFGGYGGFGYPGFGYGGGYGYPGYGLGYGGLYGR